MSTQRRLDRLTRRIVARHVCAHTPSGQCHDDPEHLAQVLATLVTCGAWTVDDVAEVARLSAVDRRKFLDGALSPVGEW